MKDFERRIGKIEAIGYSVSHGTGIVCFDITDNGYLIDGKFYESLKDYKHPHENNGLIFLPIKKAKGRKVMSKSLSIRARDTEHR